MTDQIFPRFGELPKELRVMIWGFAANEPRNVDVLIKRKKRAAGTSPMDFYLTSLTPTAAVLHASWESREATARFYEAQFSKVPLLDTVCPVFRASTECCAPGNGGAGDSLLGLTAWNSGSGFYLNPAFDYCNISFDPSAATIATTTGTTPRPTNTNTSTSQQDASIHPHPALGAFCIQVPWTSLRRVRIDIGGLPNTEQRRRGLKRFLEFTTVWSWLKDADTEEVVLCCSSAASEGGKRGEWMDQAKEDLSAFREVWDGGYEGTWLGNMRAKSREVSDAVLEKRKPSATIWFEELEELEELEDAEVSGGVVPEIGRGLEAPYPTLSGVLSFSIAASTYCVSWLRSYLC